MNTDFVPGIILGGVKHLSVNKSVMAPQFLSDNLKVSTTNQEKGTRNRNLSGTVKDGYILLRKGETRVSGLP